MPLSDEECEAAAQQASRLSGFSVPKRELLSDFFGRDGTGSMAALNGDCGCEELMDCDQELNGLFLALGPLSWAAMELTCHSRTQTSVWLQQPAGSEAGPVEALDQQDVERGVVAEHINFIRRRSLCMLYFLAAQDEEVGLLPKPGQRQEPTNLTVTRKQLLIFRHDDMAFRYTPQGASVVLQSWILGPPDALAVARIDADPQSKRELCGLLEGPPHPTGVRQWITSLASRYPGSVHTAASYWSLFAHATDAAIRIPSSRFDVDEYCVPDRDVKGKSYVYHGSFCEDADILCFDGSLFGIDVAQAQDMPPAERVLLETGYECLVGAGHTTQSLRGHRCGVALGMTTRFVPGVSTGFGKDTISNAAANSRMSHTLGMVGPMLNVDTACSSSLVATGAMADALRERDAGTPLKEGLVMGIQTMLDPWCFILFSGPQMLSPRGRGFTFDTSADGFARGEGCGALFLRSCDLDCEPHKEPSPCLMGWAVNQDGRSATLTAPSGPAQQACMRASLRETGLPYGDIVVAECHGTGTALGDTIEVNACHAVLGYRTRSLLESSAKTHIGHLEAGAGMSGLMKLATMLSSACSSPNCHLRQLNAHLKGDGFPALFVTEMTGTDWNTGLGGVSSFGFGGTNAHADVFASGRRGARSCGEADVKKADQVQVLCPITLGPIDHISGEPVRSQGRKRAKYVADVLRDDFAPYDISAYAYKGGYRFRSKAAELRSQTDSVAALAGPLYICGSWAGWRMDAMQSEGDGWYSAHGVLGEAHCEYFYIRLGEARKELYPAIDGGSSDIFVCGPDNLRDGRRWRIDAASQNQHKGVNIRLRMTKTRITITWKAEILLLASHIVPFSHSYSVVGTWTTMVPAEMRQEKGQQHCWTTSFRIGPSGQEQFYFARDGDCRQAVYPAQPLTSKTSVRATGPDDHRQDKTWLFRAPVGELVHLTLKMVDTKPIVTAASESKGQKTWTGFSGWARHQYFLSGTFNDWRHDPMKMDPAHPGVFVGTGAVSEEATSGVHGHVAEFLVTVDEDPDLAYYPEVGLSSSAESLVVGPGRCPGSRHFLAHTPHLAGAAFEVKLDLMAKDRRRIVTWSWLD